MAANFINLTDTLENWRVKANEVYGKVGDLDTLTKTATVNYSGVIGENADDFTGGPATFTVTRFNGAYSVSVELGGSGYDVNDTILVKGSSLGGSDITNDAIITVTAVDPGFAVTSASITGTSVGDLISEVNSIRDELGSLVQYALNTDAQTFYQAINEIEAVLRDGGLSTYALNTDSQDLVAAINEIETALRGAGGDYALDTDADDLVAAINEFQSEIGRVEDFDATGTSTNPLVDYVNLGSTIVSAINALKDKADINADELGGIMVDDYDGPSTNVLEALNSLYARSDLGTLDDVYVRRSGTLDMEGLLQVHSSGITSNGNNLLLKTGATDVTAVTINASNQNVGIGGNPGTNKLKVTGSINATTGLYWDGDSIDTRYLRSDNGAPQILHIDTEIVSSLDLDPDPGKTVTIGGSVVVNDDFTFLEWTQDTVGAMVTGNTEERGISAVYDDATGKINFAIANNSHNHVAANITDFIEQVQDTVGAMISGNTENGIAVTYNDTSGKLNFDVNDPTITISGEASGSATMTNLGNTNIAVTLNHEAIQDAVGEMLTGNTETGINVVYDDSANKVNFALTASPKIVLGGDLTGNVTLTNVATGDYTLTATILDDSHNHTIANIDDFTENVQDIVGAMINPTNIEAGLVVSYDDTTGKINFDVNDPTITLSGDVTGTATMTNLGSVEITTTVSNNSHRHNFSDLDNLPDPVITLNGDVSGSATMTNLGSATITVTVANDSHNHDGRYYTESEADGRFVNSSGDTITGSLAVSDTVTSPTISGVSTMHMNAGGAIRWPIDQFGGGGDTCFIDTYSFDNGESQRLRLYVDNDATDKIELNAAGGVTVPRGVIEGTATSARYADLAENYLADQEYPVGTVMSIGGEAEVTASSIVNQHSVLGVVSDKPAYLMNSELEGGTTVALKGRVPVKVIGKVKKGDRLAPSTEPGLATVKNGRDAWSFAIALEDGENGLVEAVIL